MQASDAINEFIGITAKRGYVGEIVWLDYKQMHLGGKKLYIDISTNFVDRSAIETIYDRYSSNFECGATFMLVAVSNGVRYCTLLMDSFGSDEDVEVISGRLYYYCDPYISQITLVTSKYKWLLMKYILSRRALSSLDYAFSRKQSYA